MAALRARIQNFVISVENTFLWHLGFGKPPDALVVALGCGSSIKLPPTSSHTSTLDELLNDPFLWAVPRHRRSIYVRRQRRFGTLDGFWKMIRAKDNLIICTECGGYKEAGRLCLTCYKRVKAETQEMQEKIEKELGLTPIDREVVVLYDGEQSDPNSEHWNGKRIIEMKKKRPNWFSKNLLQQSTQAPAQTKAVEPKDLA